MDCNVPCWNMDHHRLLECLYVIEPDQSFEDVPMTVGWL